MFVTYERSLFPSRLCYCPAVMSSVFLCKFFLARKRRWHFFSYLCLHLSVLPPLHLSSLRTREDMSLFLRIDFPGSGSSRPIRIDLGNQYGVLVGCRQRRAAGQVPCSLTRRVRCREHQERRTRGAGSVHKVGNPVVIEMQRLNCGFNHKRLRVPVAKRWHPPPPHTHTPSTQAFSCVLLPCCSPSW